MKQNKIVMCILKHHRFSQECTKRQDTVWDSERSAASLQTQQSWWPLSHPNSRCWRLQVISRRSVTRHYTANHKSTLCVCVCVWRRGNDGVFLLVHLFAYMQVFIDPARCGCWCVHTAFTCARVSVCACMEWVKKCVLERSGICVCRCVQLHTYTRTHTNTKCLQGRREIVGGQGDDKAKINLLTKNNQILLWTEKWEIGTVSHFTTSL